MRLSPTGTPAYLATLGFLLTVWGTMLENPAATHDASLALISGALGMFMQIFRSSNE